MNQNKIKKEIKSLWEVLCENASAWDNDDDSMAEANEKMPWDILEEFFSKVEKETREELIKEFIKGERCLTCGELKGEGGELSDTCVKCLEEN